MALKKETKNEQIMRVFESVLEDVEADEIDIDTLLECFDLDDFKQILIFAKIGAKMPYNALKVK